MNSQRPIQPDPTINGGDITGGLSSTIILAISISGFIIVLTSLAVIYKFSYNPNDQPRRNLGTNDDDEDALAYERALEDADVSTLNRAQRRARAKIRMKKNRRLAPQYQPQPAAEQQPQQPEGDAIDDDGVRQPVRLLADAPAEDDGGNNAALGGVNGERLSRKERQKAAKAEERRERLLYVEERKRQILVQEEQKRCKDRKELESKQKQNEREIEERLAQEQEYREWNLMFPPSIRDNDPIPIDNEDTIAPNTGTHCGSHETTVQQFVTELYAVKRISLAETAQRYSVSVPQLRRRLVQLEEEGRIQHCGIFDDDRGEYVVVGSEDMKKLSRYIQRAGCVTLDEVRSCLMDVLNLGSDITT